MHQGHWELSLFTKLAAFLFLLQGESVYKLKTYLKIDLQMRQKWKGEMSLSDNKLFEPSINSSRRLVNSRMKSVGHTSSQRKIHFSEQLPRGSLRLHGDGPTCTKRSGRLCQTNKPVDASLSTFWPPELGQCLTACMYFFRKSSSLSLFTYLRLFDS